MERIKLRLTQLKDAIEACEERQSEARVSLLEAKSRFDQAESEKATFKRRCLLLEGEVVKVKERLTEKQNKLANLETKKAEDENIVKELEDQEVEGDEKLESVSDLIKRGKIQAEDFDLQIREGKRKQHVLERDIERAQVKYEAAVVRGEESAEKIASLEACVKKLEARESDQSERETENEEKLVFLRNQYKESLVRAENAERDVKRLSRVCEGIIVEIENWNNKRNEVMDDMNSVTSLADELI